MKDIINTELTAIPKFQNGIANGHVKANSIIDDVELNDIALDISDIDTLTPAQKCFGEKSDVERILDNRCPCLQSKCLHLSGSLIFFILAGVFVIVLFRHHLKEVLEWLQDVNGWISGLIFVAMFTIVSFPMTWGYILLNVACGYLYGALMGTLTASVSVLVGVAVSLVCCRIFIRDFIQSKLQSEHLKAIIRVIESRRGFKVILLTRLTPIPFGLQNGLFAITDMSISKCLLASSIGLLPTQALNAYMGSTLRNMEDVIHHKNSAGGYLLLALQVAIGAFLMWYVVRRARYELNKECLPTSYEDINCTTPPSLQRTHSSKFSIGDIKYEPLPTIDIDAVPRIKKQTHKRAQSASAILYALENKDDSF